MDKLLDFSKYTMAIAVAMMLYVPANFVPRATEAGSMAVLAAMAMLLISTLAAFLLFSRVTTLVVTGQSTDSKGWTKFWGRIHLSLLGIAFLVVAVMFYDTKLASTAAAPRCTFDIPAAEGTSAVRLSFDCAAELGSLPAPDRVLAPSAGPGTPNTDTSRPEAPPGGAAGDG